MLSYIYWDPNPKIFTLPLIERPVVWYGVLFALGFYLAYLIFEKLIKEFLCVNVSFKKEHFHNFSGLLMELNHNKDHPFVKDFLYFLPKDLREGILQWNFSRDFNEKSKNDLIDHFNLFLEVNPQDYLELNDSRLKKIFIKFKTKKGKRLFPRLKKRLKFEELLPETLTPLYLRSKQVVEKVVIYTLIATIIGARLGHIVFYEDLSWYLSHPLDVLKTWEGGLASHGGILGIIIAFIIFRIRNKNILYPLRMLNILDFSVIAACLTSFFIRLGNFINQEIIGTVTQVPWAIVFGHPLDGSYVMPRHPTQLYEGFFYLFLFVSLLLLRNKAFFKAEGKISAVFFISGFIFRFFIEFLKEEQSVHTLVHLKMGQILSLPVIVFGVVLFAISQIRGKRLKEKLI